MTLSTRLLLPAACAVPLLGLAFAWIYGPPLIFSDTATGLLAWRNFVAGGIWNTIAEPSTLNLAENIQRPVTWWSPGQYVPAGLLLSAGLPLGAAVLLVALLAAWSSILGVTALVRELGAPRETLPWVALATAASWHTLQPFGMFNGGECALAAVWPWIFLLLYRCRHRPWLLSVAIPPLFLLGIFAKHSFMIFGLAMLLFLWLEACREAEWKPGRVIAAVWPLLAGGLLFLVGRHLLFDAGPSPADPGQLPGRALTAYAFSSWAPLFASGGFGSLMGRAFMISGLGFEEGWSRLAPALAIASPIALGLYFGLSRRKEPFMRLAGTVALVSGLMLCVLIGCGGNISQEDRHFRPAGLLLLAVLVHFCAARQAGRPRLQLAARGVLAAVLVFGIGAAVQRHLNLRRLTHPAGNHTSLADMPPNVLREARSMAAAASGSDAILYLPTPEIACQLPTCRMIVTDALAHDATWISARSYRGIASAVHLIVPQGFSADGRTEALLASFVDYPRTAWSSRRIGEWEFWSARGVPGRPSV